jgi:hypothetical protein
MKLKALMLSAMLGLASVHPKAAAAQAQGAPAQPPQMAAANYLIGTWQCAHNVGTFSGTYTTTYSWTLGNAWLRQIWDFPAQVADGRNQAAITAETLMRYDERRQAWVRFFANSLGQHFEIRMTDTPNGWSFKYVSFFPRTRPETPDPDAIFTRRSDTEYTVDGPTYPHGTEQVTEHHRCHKL